MPGFVGQPEGSRVRVSREGVGVAHNGLMSALDSRNGQVRLISEVPSGAACQCICAECRGVLVARKGRVRAHHFAHKQGEAGSLTACQETALHNAAKRLLAYHLDSISVPPLTIQRPTKQFVLPTENTVKFKKKLLLEGTSLSLCKGDIEPLLETSINYRPDALAHSKLLGKIYFEVYVTHPVPEAKKAAYQALGLWVLEIDLSECDPSQVGLERLSELVAREAKRHWLSCGMPDDVQESLNEYETTVTELQERQEQAFKEELQKPTSKNWSSSEKILLKNLQYQKHEYPVNQMVPTPTIIPAKGYWVTESIGGIRLPVFWEPHKEAVIYLQRKYRKKRERALSCVLASDNGATIELGEQSRLAEVMRWVLHTLAGDSPRPIHHILGLERQLNQNSVPSSAQMFNERWVSLWADPALDNVLKNNNCVCANVPESFARACILWGAADMIVLANGKAFANTRILNTHKNLQNRGDVYTAIRLRSNSLSPLPCRLIMVEGGYSRSLNIARHIQVQDGRMYLHAMGAEIPVVLTPPVRKDNCPIYMNPALSYPDESALFQANEDALTDFLYKSFQRNRDAMNQYHNSETILASFVSFFQQQPDGT